jgi:glutathione S-transferase
MATLYHYWLSQGSRFIRLVLAEKDIPFTMELETPWAPRPGFRKMSPSGWPPVLALGGGTPALSDARSIAEYVEEVTDGPALLGGNALERAEVRRLLGWFENRFASEVSDPLLYERRYRAETSAGAPDAAAIRTARQNLRYHLAYIGELAAERRWMAGNAMTLADLAAAAHVSVLDYLGEMRWEDSADVRDWYSRMKSRPSFRPLLADRVPGFPPPDHYDDLDF